MNKTQGMTILCLGLFVAAGVAETVTLSVTNAPLAKVLEEVSRQTGRQITLAAPSDRRVTLNLQGLPGEQALRTICESAECTLTADGEGFIVTPNPSAREAEEGFAEETPPPEPEEVLLSFDFEDGVGPWASVEPLGQVRVAMEPEHVHSGEAALEYEYIVGGIPPEQQKKPTLRLLRELRELAEAGDLEAIKARLAEYLPEPKFTAVVAPEPFDLSGARSVRFWLKTSTTTSLVLSFSGPWVDMYGTVFYSPANTWQQVWISLDRFQRDEKDPNRHEPVDLSQVQGIAFLDAAMFLTQMTDKELEEPQRRLWVDDFQVTTAESPNASRLRTDDGRRFLSLDDFSGGYIGWIPISGQLALETEPGLGQPFLHWSYPGGPEQMRALFRPLTHLPPEGAQAVRLKLRTRAPATLALLLEEEEDKSTYLQTVEVQPDLAWQEYLLDLEDFTLDENKTDENGQLDLDEVTHLMLLDASALFGQAGAGEIDLAEVTLELEPE